MKRKNKSWYKPKGYFHISSKLKQEDKDYILYYIKHKILSHNFFPLIHETLLTRKFKKYSTGRNHFDIENHKSSAKPREIFYANHLDAQIYNYYSTEILGKAYEELLKSNPKIDESVIAYRRIPVKEGELENKSNIHLANELFLEIAKRGNCVVVCYDIKNFFPSINHNYLKHCWLSLLNVDRLPLDHYKIFQSVTKYSFIELQDILAACKNSDLGLKNKFYFRNSDFDSYFIKPKEFRDKIAKKNLIKINKKGKTSNEPKGIPQGIPISPLLANLYLLEFDKFIVNNLVTNLNCYYRRYSDDIIMIFPNQEDFLKWDQKIQEFLSEKPMLLEIQDEKTQISKFTVNPITKKLECFSKDFFPNEFTKNQNLSYLGFEYNGNVIRLKPASLSKYYRNMKEAIRRRQNKVILAQNYNTRHKNDKPHDTKLYLTNIYKRFTHLGKNKSKGNFLTYVDRASKIIYSDSIKCNAIRNQVKRSWSIFIKTISKYYDIYFQ